MSVRVKLDLIVFDAGTQIREAIDPQVVTDYAEAMTNGANFPPVVLFHDGNRHYLGDGFHRFMAAQRLSFKEIEAEVKAGTKDDALWYALGANKVNGHRMTAKDKRHAIEVALHVFGIEGGKSVRDIAEQAGCAKSYVHEVQSELSASGQLPERVRVTGRDGKSHPATKSAVVAVRRGENPKRPAIVEMITAGRTSVDIKNQLHVSPELVAEVRRELGVGTVDKSKAALQERRDRMREMAAAGYSSRQIAAAIGVGEGKTRLNLRELGIDVPADRVVGNSKNHDANRIVEHIVMDAENLTADVNLIDFSQLDPDRLGDWADSLVASKRALSAFIQRLLKEKQKHDQVA